MFYVLLARISPVIEKSTIGAILNNASSPFDFNANFSARRSSRRGFSGKRTAIAGMTAVSLALSGLAVPSVVGGEVQVAEASGVRRAQVMHWTKSKGIKLSIASAQAISGNRLQVRLPRIQDKNLVQFPNGKYTITTGNPAKPWAEVDGVGTFEGDYAVLTLELPKKLNLPVGTPMAISTNQTHPDSPKVGGYWSGSLVAYDAPDETEESTPVTGSVPLSVSGLGDGQTVEVRIVDENGVTRGSDKLGNGSFVLSGMAPGSYSVSVSGWPADYRVTSAGGDKQTVRIDNNGQSDRRADFAFKQNTGSVPVSVSGLGSGQKVQVRVVDANGVTQWSDEVGNGNFAAPGMVAGSYSVSVSGWRSDYKVTSPGGSEQTVRIDNNGQSDRRADFTFKQNTGSIPVSVSGLADGARVWMVLSNMAGEVKWSGWQGNGSFSLSPFIADKYVMRVSAWPNDYRIVSSGGSERSVEIDDDGRTSGKAEFEFNQNKGAITGSVSGLVGNDKATVIVRQVDGRQVYTQELGNGEKFETDALTKGVYNVFVSKPSDYRMESDAVVEVFVDHNGEASRTADFKVAQNKGAVAGSVSGLFGDDTAEVVVKRTDGQQVFSQVLNNGQSFVTSELAKGTYIASLKKPGHYQMASPAEFTISINDEGQASKTADFKVTPNDGSVSGDIVDDRGKPVPGVKVVLVDENGKKHPVVVESDGSIKEQKLRPGTYTVEVDAPEGYTEPKIDQPVTVKPGEKTTIPAIEVRADDGSVSGDIVDDRGKPVPGVKVVLVDESGKKHPVVVESDGSIKEQKLRPGTYTVEVDAPQGYTDPEIKDPVVVKPGQSTVIPAITVKKEEKTEAPTTSTLVPEPTTDKPAPEPQPQPQPEPEPTEEETTPAETKPSITGTVKDKYDKPLPQDGEGKPNVTVYGPDGKKIVDKVEITDPEGNFEIHGPDDKPLPDGKYIVEVETPEGMNNPRPKIVEVKDGESKPIEFEVDKSERDRKDKSDRIGENTVGGWLIDEHGNPIQGAKIKFIKKDVADPNTISVDPRTEETKGPEYFDYEIPLSVDGDGFFVTPEIDFQYFPEGVVDFDMEIELPEGWPDTDINGKPLNRKVTVKQGERTDIGEIRVKAPIDQSIEGNINDGNGNAVPGTKVVVTDPNGDSKVIGVEDDGSFKIDKIKPGVNEIEILTPGSDREIDKIKVPVRPGDDVKLPEIQLTKNASLKLEKQVWGRDADNLGQVKDKDGNLVDDVMTTLPGEDLYYELFITNTGDTPIKNIDIDDPELQSRNIELKMPEGWTAELAPGETEVIKAKMKAPEDAFDFNNVATAFGETSTGEKVGSAPDSAYTKFIKAEVHKKVNARFATNPDKPVRMSVGNALKFTYEIQNTGSAPMVNVELKDAIFEGDAKDKDGNDVPADQLKKVKDLEIKKPEGFNGTLLPGQRVIFTAEIPEGLATNVRHHNQAEARGELPTRPARGRGLAGEPDYGDDPSSTLIISPRENLKGNAHIIVDQGAPLADNLRLIAWVDENQNRTQDENESLAGLKVKLVPTDGGPSIAGETNEDGNVYFESTPWGEYTFQITNPGNLRLIDPRDPEKNSSRPGSILETEPFKVRGKFSEPFELRPAADDPSQKEIVIDLQLKKDNSDIAAGGGIGKDNEIVGEDGSSLGKCLATASSASNPVAWLVPIGLLGAVAGGIGVMFEDELNAAAAQANEAMRSVMPNVNIEVPSVFNQFQAQIDQVNRQLSQINPAAPAAVAGVGLLAVAGLIMGLYYASCQLGWNVETEGSSSTNKAEATETAKPEEPAEPAES